MKYDNTYFNLTVKVYGISFCPLEKNGDLIELGVDDSKAEKTWKLSLVFLGALSTWLWLDSRAKITKIATRTTKLLSSLLTAKITV